MCGVSIKGAQNSQVLIHSLHFFMAAQNPMWNNMTVHPTWKKHSVERRGGGSLLIV